MIRLYPPVDMLETTVGRLPLSKSVAARALVLGAISGSEVEESKLPDNTDIRVLRDALSATDGTVDVADSGTALRFLTAYFATRDGCDVVLSGSERLCDRPISPLVDTLRLLGADIEYTGRSGFAPLRIKGRRLAGGEVDIDSKNSSQFVSALAMVAPTMQNGLRINMGGQIPSMPYLKMTLSMLEARGIEAYIEAYTAVIRPGTLNRIPAEAEYDWSAASYWYSISAVSAGWVTIPGLKRDSLQGDSVLQKIGDRFGVITEFSDGNTELSATPDIFSRLDMDMADWPDLVPTLAVTACMIGLPFVFTGVSNLRLKECDRLEAIAKNLARLGIVCETGTDSLSWEGERMPITLFPRIDPCNDHRIAMAFAVASLHVPGLIIEHPEVVDKSYPGFFDDLADAGFFVCGPDDPVPEPYQTEE